MPCIGIEIGGTKLQVVIGEPKTNKIEKTFRYQIDKEKGAEGILRQIESILKNLEEKPKAIGVGFGGPINRDSGCISTSVQIEGWSGFDLKKWLYDRYNVPIFIENDANTAALAESLYGAGKKFEHVFYVTLGSGVGGGMVVNRTIYHGANPGESEIGQIQIDRHGNTLESLCSGWALDERIRKVISDSSSNSILKDLVGSATSQESRILASAIKSGDKVALKLLDEYADTLCWGLSHAIHLFHPQVIILGGGVSLIGEPLRLSVEKLIPQYIAKIFHHKPAISLSILKEQVVPIGALNLIKI